MTDSSDFLWQDPLLALANASAPVDAELVLSVTQAVQDGGEDTEDVAAKKKAFKQKAAIWGQSRPLPRLLLLSLVLAIVRKLQHRFFHLGSEAYNRQQNVKSAKGQPRNFKVLEVASGNDIKTAMSSISDEFLKCPTPFPISDQTLRYRGLAFRLLSRCGGGLHQLMRSVHRGHPYRLFLLLAGVSEVVDDPPCMMDELSQDFVSRFAGRETGDMAMTFLEFVAEAVEIDIASMEARHAFNRRATILKSLQTWTASLEAINTLWVLRQARRARDKCSGSVKAAKSKGETANKKQQKNERKKRSGGGGGPYRAFIHVNYAGVRLTRDRLREVAREYRKLSEVDAQYYKELGRLGTMAWQQAVKNKARARGVAFGNPLPSASRPPGPSPPNTVLDSGIVVGADVPKLQALVPVTACSFEKGIKMLTAHQRRVAKDMAKTLQEEDELLARHQEEVSTSVPSLLSEVPTREMVSSACQAGSALPVSRLEWNAPSIDFAAVARLHLDSSVQLFDMISIPVLPFEIRKCEIKNLHHNDH